MCSLGQKQTASLKLKNSKIESLCEERTCMIKIRDP